MKTNERLCWTVLPMTKGLQRLGTLGIELPPEADWQSERLALLHPATRPDEVVAWREVGEPQLYAALTADQGPGSGARLTDALRAGEGDWWRTAHAWTAFARWNPNHREDWDRWLAPCAAPDDDGLASLLAPTRGWLMWDFQFIAAMSAAGVGWDTADALRRDWTLQRPGIEARLAALRIGGVPFEQALRRRTLPPLYQTTRLDAWPVQRLARWASAAAAGRTAARTVNATVGFSLSEDEARRVKAWAGPMVTGHINEDVEFPGIEFVLWIGPFGEQLEARVDRETLQLR